MAGSPEGDMMIQQIERTQKPFNLVQPVQGTNDGAVTLPVVNSVYDFLNAKHRIYSAWLQRWTLNEARLAGGDDVINELRAFEWETDLTPTGFYAKRQAEAVYTNFPDIFSSSITGHLLRFAPKPDQGWSVPNLGKVADLKTSVPSQAEQVWYSVDNPSGAGAEWNQYWGDICRRAMATGHRWLYVDSPSEASGNREREQQGYRPYLVEFSPIDTYNWFINAMDITEFVVFRIPDDGPQIQNGIVVVPNLLQRGYLLLVREGCQRLGNEFIEGGWWKFDYNQNLVDHDIWVDTFGEIPVSILYYQRSKGTTTIPAISRPGLTELGQAAIAGMNMMSAANYNAWEAGGGVDYLNGIDEDAFAEVERLSKLGSRRIPLPPNSETDVVPSVSPSSLGAVQSDVFVKREQAIWDSAVRLGIIEMAGPVTGGKASNSGASAEAAFSVAQGPRIVWFAQNLAVCQNNIIRYFELRYGHSEPTGSVAWPSRFDLANLVDRIRSFFEIERLSGIRSGTAGALAMVQAADDKGLVNDPQTKKTMYDEYMASSKVMNQIQQNQATLMNPPAPSNGTVGQPRNNQQATKNSNREALKKVVGKRGPKQPPSIGANRTSKA